MLWTTRPRYMRAPKLSRIVAGVVVGGLIVVSLFLALSLRGV